MGWGRWLLLGDLGQQLDLQEQRAELERARIDSYRRDRHARINAKVLAEIRAECDELKLYLAALIRHLVNKSLATTDEVIELVEAIDREDGTPDGRTTAGLPKRAKSAARAVPPEPEPLEPDLPRKSMQFRPRPKKK